MLTRRGRWAKSIALVSHLDTVFPPEEEARNGFHWQPDGDRIYGPGTHDIKGGGEKAKFEGHKGAVTSIAYSKDGKMSASGSTDHTARLWNIEEGEEIRKFQGHTDEVRCVLFSPDGSRALTASRDTTIRLWRVPQ